MAFSLSPAGWIWPLAAESLLELELHPQVQLQVQLHLLLQLFAALVLVGIEKKIINATAAIAFIKVFNIVIFILLLKNYVVAPTLLWVIKATLTSKLL